jgi:hypothetical protein
MFHLKRRCPIAGSKGKDTWQAAVPSDLVDVPFLVEMHHVVLARRLIAPDDEYRTRRVEHLVGTVFRHGHDPNALSALPLVRQRARHATGIPRTLSCRLHHHP